MHCSTRALEQVSAFCFLTSGLALGASPLSAAPQIDAGEAWNFQFWHRDSASTGAGFNLSNGLSATFCRDRTGRQAGNGAGC